MLQQAKFKFLITLIILINIGFPINGLFNFFIFVTSLLFIFSNKINNKQRYISFYYMLIIFLTLVNIFLFKNEKIEEAHSLFITKKDVEIISQFLPNQLINKLSDDLNNFDYERYKEGRGSTANGKLYIQKSYAFSADSFFQNNKYSRQIFEINFDTRSEHRIGQFNTIPFAMPYDQDLKENFPFYVLYELPQSFAQSTICGEGKLFISYSKRESIQNLKFKSFGNNYECITLPVDYNKYYIFGYSIDAKDNFIVKLNKNYQLKIINYLNNIFIITIFLIILMKLIRIKINKHLILILLSLISSFILAYMNDPNVLLGLRHVYGGADGLIFNSFSSDIIENLKNGKLALALRGGEDVYYFQPGMRYYLTIFKIFFGETNFGYILIVSLLPYLIFLIFEKITRTKIAYILYFLFVFFPIFESMGFGHFNYIRQAVRAHAESLSIFFIVLSIYLIIIKNSKYSQENIILLFIGILLSQAIFLRPNFLPTCLVLSLYLIISNIQNKNFITKNIIYIFSFSGVLIGLAHNYYFGERLTFFSSSVIHIIFFKEFSALNFTETKGLFEFIIRQLKDWNDLVYLPRLLILIYVIYNIYNYNKYNIVFYLILCCISQHIVLLLTHASSRYAYLAWLLTFILFIKILYDKGYLDKILIRIRELIVSKN